MDPLPSSQPPVIPESTAPATPWPLWPTVGLSTVIVVAGLLVQIFVVFIVIGIMAVVRGSMPDAKGLEQNGILVAFATAAMTPVVVGLVVLFARLRKGMSVGEYLDLRWPSKSVAIRWLIALIGLIIVSDTVTFLLGRPIVPPFMVETSLSAGSLLPFLWLAMILAAPLSEEFFFRGFLFTGLQQTRLRFVGTAIITAALWAVIHSQYDTYGILTIFVGGLFLAAVRAKTRSLWLCVILHATMNLIATVESIIYVRFFH